MPVRSQDLHGSVPDNATVALLLIDVINDLDFPGSEALLEQAIPMAKRISELKKRAKALGIPSVYVNDNFGKWQSDFRKLLRHCLHDDVVGRPMVEILQPDPDDYFVLKPKHSGFYSTNLEVLLQHLHADTLILTGVAGNICVLFTANDAYMRDYRLLIPSDCTVSNTAQENEHALQLMQRVPIDWTWRAN
jgi:nicotinamidase-related amidase